MVCMHDIYNDTHRYNDMCIVKDNCFYQDVSNVSGCTVPIIVFSQQQGWKAAFVVVVLTTAWHKHNCCGKLNVCKVALLWG